MLSDSPQIIRVLTQTSGFKPVIFIQIESDKGITGAIKYIDNLEDFYINYNSTSESMSYNLAVHLLSVGYSLLIQRVNKSSDRQSLRLLSSDNPIKYVNGSTNVAYPKYGTDYNYMHSEEGNVTGNTYAYTIVINRRILPTDYIMLHTGLVWKLIYFNKTSVPIPANLYAKGFYVNNDSPTDDNNLAISELVRILKTKLGFLISIESDSNEVRITVYNYHRSLIPMTTFTDSYVPAEINNDIYCRLTEAYRVCDFFSLVNDSVKDIDIAIYKNFNLYNILISLINPLDGSQIYNETYNVSLDPNDDNFIEIINTKSKLVSVKYYKGELISGTYSMDRGCVTEQATITDYITYLDNFSLTGIYPSIIVDGGLDNEVYLNRLAKFVNDFDTPSVLLALYHNNFTINTFRMLGLFNGYVEINSVRYPAYTYLLDLLANGMSEGKITNVIYFPYSLSTNYEVNTIELDDYGSSKLVNPLAYQSKNNLVPCGLMIGYSIAICDFLGSIDTASDNTKNSLYDKLNKSIDKAKSFTRTEFNITLDSVNMTDRYLRVSLTVDLNYQTSKDFGLTISITRYI